MDKLSFDSTSSIKGIIFQFLVALKCCFEMQEGESVYIEHFGDVSVIGDEKSEQIESKYYKRSLSDLDKNIWNTISNWIDISFPLERFSSLVLLTTQKAGERSKWNNWNEKPLIERKHALTEIRNTFLRRQRKDPKITSIMERVFAQDNVSRFDDIVKKLSIDTLAVDNISYYNRMRDIYGGHLPKIRREEYINALYGYIINPYISENNWEISYDGFCKEKEELSKKLQDNTVIFPNKIHLKDIDTNSYAESSFIQKIKDIEYDEDEVIQEAVSNYLNAGQIIAKEINNSPTIKTSYETYEEALEHTYNLKYRKACRNCKKRNEIIERSQDLYDDIMLSNDRTFHTYKEIPPFFHNGVMHILAEEKLEIVWKLKLKKNE